MQILAFAIDVLEGTAQHAAALVEQGEAERDNDHFGDRDKDQVAQHLAQVDDAAVHRAEQQTIQATLIPLQDKRAGQAQHTGKGNGHPQHTRGNRIGPFHREIEREAENQDQSIGNYTGPEKEFHAG